MDVKEWYYAVTPRELDQIALKCGTTKHYMRLIKSSWSNPSLKLKTKIIEAAREITPGRIPEFVGESKRPGRKIEIDEALSKKIVKEYRCTSTLIEDICKKLRVSKNTIYAVLRRYDIEPYRWKTKKSKLGGCTPFNSFIKKAEG